jgi:arylsulfatase A-like enzyme
MNHADTLPDGIAIVTIDRLPAWMLPAYGSAWVAMPHLDAVAGRGLVLDRVIATSDDPLATLQQFAGTSPAALEAWPIVATALEHGWPVALVTDDADLAAVFPSPADVQHVPIIAATEPARSESETNLGRLFAAAASLVVRGKHRLVWCHASSLDVVWDAPLELRERYLDPDDPPPPPTGDVPDITFGPEADPDIAVSIRHVFAGQLSLLDGCIGRLVEAVTARRGAWTILIAGGRGLPLGLHGRIGCNPIPPYGELVHLPAIFADHRGRMASQRFGGLLIPADLGATLLDLVGHRPAPPAPPALPQHGQSLTPLLDQWHGPDRDRVIVTTVAGTGVATPAWHLVLPTITGDLPHRGHLFAKPDDFFELCDVADRCPAVADELAALATGDPERAWEASLSSEAVHGL